MAVIFAGYSACKSHNKPAEKEIVKNPEEIDGQVADNLKSVLQYADDNNGKIDDSTNLALHNIISIFYGNNGYQNLWSKKGTGCHGKFYDKLYSVFEILRALSR